MECPNEDVWKKKIKKDRHLYINNVIVEGATNME